MYFPLWLLLLLPVLAYGQTCPLGQWPNPSSTNVPQGYDFAPSYIGVATTFSLGSITFVKSSNWIIIGGRVDNNASIGVYANDDSNTSRSPIFLSYDNTWANYDASIATASPYIVNSLIAVSASTIYAAIVFNSNLALFQLLNFQIFMEHRCLHSEQV
jgi:hypothetical protein